MLVTEKYLEELGFKITHTLAITMPAGSAPGEPSLRFEPTLHAGSVTGPCVYIWAARLPRQDGLEVIYVGKAGKGIERRCKQHEAGFKHSGTGRKNADALRQLLEGNQCELLVFARVSDVRDLFGIPTSLFAAEEDALCRLLVPRLNRAVFPDVSALAPPPEGDTQIDLAEDAGRNSQLAQLAPQINARLRVWDDGTIEDVESQLGTLDPQYLRILADMLKFLEDHVLQPEHELKIIGQYSDQIEGCNGVTTLGFGTLANRNFKPNGWVARIYLADVPRIAFPERLRNPHGTGKVDEATGLFSPQDPKCLFEAPEDFIAPDHLR